MIDDRTVWRTVAEKAESLIQREYGGTWQSKSFRAPREHDNVANSLSAEFGDSLADDLSALADADYRDLISALYDNLPEDQDQDQERLCRVFDDEQSALVQPTGRLNPTDDELTVDANFLHSQILPNSGSAGDLFDFIVFGHSSSSEVDPKSVENEGAALTSRTSENASNSAVEPEASSSKLYRCINCDYSTRSRTQFWRHRKAFDHFAVVSASPPGKAPLLRCALCDYVTRARFNLTRHVERIHIGERRVACDKCAALFKDKDALRRHAVYRHADEAPHECPQCARRFATVADVRRHARLVHDGVRAHACARCMRLFQTRANARRHFDAGICVAK